MKGSYKDERRTEMTDERLIEMFLSRDEGAIAASEEKYLPFCHSVLSNILPNKEDREECINDAMLVLWNTIPPENPASFSAYLAKILRTIALERTRRENAWKRGGRVLTVGEEFLRDITDGRTLADDYESSRAGRIINEFLEGLSKNDRKVFILRYWFDEDISRIAARMNYTESRTKSLLKRLRDRLRLKLEKEGIVV